jgi:hypothetical protein
MKYIKAFFTWPRSEKNPYMFPWWRIVWNMLWMPLAFVGACCYVLAITMQQGPKRAMQEWKGLF